MTRIGTGGHYSRFVGVSNVHRNTQLPGRYSHPSNQQMRAAPLPQQFQQSAHPADGVRARLQERVRQMRANPFQPVAAVAQQVHQLRPQQVA